MIWIHLLLLGLCLLAIDTAFIKVDWRDYKTYRRHCMTLACLLLLASAMTIYDLLAMFRGH